MISQWLLAADLVDAVANPSRTIEEHETGAARLAALAAHGARIDNVSLDGATDADVDLLPEHIWRWALDQAKSNQGESRTRLPDAELFDRLYGGMTDRLSRLLLVEAVLTHPDVDDRFRGFEEQGGAVPLEQLPDVWPRDQLIRLTAEPGGETAAGLTQASLLELGMILLQIATPASLALLGGVITALQARQRDRHPLVESVRVFLADVDPELAARFGLL